MIQFYLFLKNIFSFSRFSHYTLVSKALLFKKRVAVALFDIVSGHCEIRSKLGLDGLGGLFQP